MARKTSVESVPNLEENEASLAEMSRASGARKRRSTSDYLASEGVVELF
jgi:hypothetical protein